MKKYSLLIFLVMFYCLSFSQTSFRIRIDSTSFSNPLGSQGDKIVRCTDGGFCIAGYTIDQSLVVSVKLVKTDSSGNIEWCKVYGSWNEISHISLASTLDGGFYLVIGEFYIGGYSSYRYDILRLNGNGNMINKKSAEWGTRFADTGAMRLMTKETYSDNFDIIWWRPVRDQSTGDLIGNYTYFSRIDTSFNFLFSKRVDIIVGCTKEISINNTVAGFLIGGMDTDSSDNASLVKMDTFGNVLWKKKYTGSAQNFITSIAQVDSSFFMMETSPNKIALRKIDFSGNTIFYKAIDSTLSIGLLSLSTLAKMEVVDSSHLLITFFLQQDPYIIEADFNGVITKAIKGSASYYTGSAIDVSSNAVLCTIRDTSGQPSQSHISFEVEFIDNPSCYYTPLNLFTLNGMSTEAVSYPAYDSSVPVFITNYIDTVSYFNVITTPVCYSVVTSTDFDKRLNMLNIYPNPSSSVVTVRLTEEYKNAQLKIYNCMGKEIYSSDFNNALTIDLSAFAKGFYFASVTNTEKQLTTKFVLE